jgi:hypothetical protein
MPRQPDRTLRSGTADYTVLVDEKGVPYKAGVTIQQVEGGFDPTGLATDAKQDEIVTALGAVADAVSTESAVTILDDELPPVQGQATSNKQDAIISALNTLASRMDMPLDVEVGNDSITVSIPSLPLADGAATSAKQDQALEVLGVLRDIFQNGTLGVTGELGLKPADIAALKTVTLDNPSIAITSSSPLSVNLPGVSTADKQDAILARLQTLIDNSLAPRPITDNSGSITVDGAVGISGPVQVEDNGKSLTVDGMVAATQSGPWNVTVTDGSGPLTVDGSVAVTDATGNGLTSATAAPGTSDRGLVVRNIPSGTQAVSGTVAATQSGTWTMNVNSAPSATAPALTPFRTTSLTATPQQIKASAGRVYQYSFHNPNNAPVYVHFWGLLAANVTPGTTVPAVTLGVPAGSVLDGYWTVSPAAFASGITVSASTSSAGTGAPNTGLLAQVGYV